MLNCVLVCSSAAIIIIATVTPLQCVSMYAVLHTPAGRTHHFCCSRWCCCCCCCVVSYLSSTSMQREKYVFFCQRTKWREREKSSGNNNSKNDVGGNRMPATASCVDFCDVKFAFHCNSRLLNLLIPFENFPSCGFRFHSLVTIIDAKCEFQAICLNTSRMLHTHAQAHRSTYISRASPAAQRLNEWMWCRCSALAYGANSRTE